MTSFPVGENTATVPLSMKNMESPVTSALMITSCGKYISFFKWTNTFSRTSGGMAAKMVTFLIKERNW